MILPAASPRRYYQLSKARCSIHRKYPSQRAAAVQLDQPVMLNTQRMARSPLPLYHIITFTAELHASYFTGFHSHP